MPWHFKKCFFICWPDEVMNLRLLSTSKIAPIMRDDYVVKECAIIFHDVCTDWATGYPGFVPHLSLLMG